MGIDLCLGLLCIAYIIGFIVGIIVPFKKFAHNYRGNQPADPCSICGNFDHIVQDCPFRNGSVPDVYREPEIWDQEERD